MVLFCRHVQVSKQWFHIGILVILQLFPSCLGIPIGSILTIKPDCSSVGANTPIIMVTSDLNIQPSAYCSNGNKDFITTDKVHYKLFASFTSTNKPGYCQFHQRQNTGIYSIKITVAWGEDEAKIQTHNEVKILTCTFDDYGLEKTDSTNLTRSDMAPREIQINTGTKLPDADFALQVVNVLQQPITGSIPKGRKVSLMITAKKSAGLHVMGCVASPGVSGITREYPIIRYGCGDGRIFKRERGFITTGQRSLSPYFEMFQVDIYNTIQFHCNVTACAKKCDGSSCAVESDTKRSRRSIGEMKIVETTTLFVNN